VLLVAVLVPAVARPQATQEEPYRGTQYMQKTFGLAILTAFVAIGVVLVWAARSKSEDMTRLDVATAAVDRSLSRLRGPAPAGGAERVSVAHEGLRLRAD
jgi:hypothetical protein